MSGASPRRTLVGALVAVAAGVLALGVLPGCGGEEADEALLDALSYLDANTALVAVASTELEGSGLAEVEQLASRLPGWEGVLSALREAATVGGGSFEVEVESQLGEPLVVSAGIEGNGMRAALRLRSADALRRGVERAAREGEVKRLPGYEGAILWEERDAPLAFGAVHEETLVLAESEEQVRAAIDSSADPDNLSTRDALVSRLEHPDEEPPLRFAADAQRAVRGLDAGERARQLPWVRALDIAGGGVAVDGDELVATVELDTDRRELAPEDLPIAEGPSAPQLPAREAGVAAGLRAPARTAAFALELLAVIDADPEGGVLDAVEEVRSLLDLDPVEDIAGSIDELWLALDGEGAVAFGARLNDPAGLEAELRRAPLFVATLLEGLGVEGAVLEVVGETFLVVRDGEELARFEIDGEELRGSLEPPPLEPLDAHEDDARGALRGSAGGGLLALLVPEGELGAELARLLDAVGPLTLEVESGTTATRASARLPLDPAAG